MQVKPAFDPALLKLRDQMQEGSRKMQTMAGAMAGRLGLGEGRVKLEYRCVSVLVWCVKSVWMDRHALPSQPTVSPTKNHTHTNFQPNQNEHIHIIYKYSSAHQHHFRLTKKDQPALKKADASGGGAGSGSRPQVIYMDVIWIYTCVCTYVCVQCAPPCSPIVHPSTHTCTLTLPP